MERASRCREGSSIKDVVDLPVEALTERNAVIGQHFSRPEVQYVGSSSGCGCDFPHAIFQNGDWPEMEYNTYAGKDELDIARDVVRRRNCAALVALLQTTGEDSVELYGVWDGDFAVVPKARESISIESLLDPNFCFKEQGFYKVSLRPAPKS